MARRKTGAPPDAEPVVSEPVDFDDSAPITADQELEEWLIERADLEKHYSTKVFRIRQAPGQPEQVSYLKSFTGAIVTYDQIGQLFGSGKYRIYLFYTPKGGGKRQGTSRTIEIDPQWAEVNGMPVAPAQVPALMPAAPADGFNAPMVVGMFEAFTKAMIAMSRPQGGNGQAAELLAGVSEAFTKITARAAEQQLALIGKLGDRAMGIEEQDEDQGGQVEGILGVLRWVWSTFGEKLISMPAPMQKMAAAQAREIAEIKYLLTHPGDYQAVYDSFLQESGVEESRFQALLHNLGLPLPSQLVGPGPAGGKQPGAGE
jgi:hypothetical protein